MTEIWQINLGSTERWVGKDCMQTPPTDIPPLGFFLSRRYPNANHIDAADTNGVVLQNPGVDMFGEAFPIPITFYEDIQQEAFWSVGVRCFGHGLLHYRSRNQATRYTMTISPTTGKVKHSKKTRFQLLGHTYPALNNQFMADVETLRVAVTLTLQERQAMEFGRDLLISSQNEEIFWNNSAKQAELVRSATAFMIAAAQQGHSIQNQGTVFIGLIQSTAKAISNHEIQIAAIQSLEAVNRVAYLDRRAALKAWNRNTRVFLNGIRTLDRGGVLDVRSLMLHLEVARMVLFDPTDPSLQTTEEYIEIQSVSLARMEYTDGNFINCRNVCLGLLGTDWCSIFARCAAAAILFALDKDISMGWDRRKLGLVMANEMMEHCATAAPASWKPFWVTLKTELMDMVTVLQRPPDPSFQGSNESTAGNGT